MTLVSDGMVDVVYKYLTLSGNSVHPDGIRNALEAVAPLIAKEVQERIIEAIDDQVPDRVLPWDAANLQTLHAAEAVIRALDLTGDKK